MITDWDLFLKTAAETSIASYAFNGDNSLFSAVFIMECILAILCIILPFVHNTNREYKRDAVILTIACFLPFLIGSYAIYQPVASAPLVVLILCCILLPPWLLLYLFIQIATD